MIQKQVLFLGLFFFSALSWSQSLSVMEIAPASHAISAARDAEITIELDQALDPTTVNAGTVKVFGRWPGPASGSNTIEGGTKIIFQADEPFFAGEWIRVSLTKGLKSNREILQITNFYATI